MFPADRYPITHKKEKSLSLSLLLPQHTKAEQCRQCLTVMPNAEDNHEANLPLLQGSSASCAHRLWAASWAPLCNALTAISRCRGALELSNEIHAQFKLTNPLLRVSLGNILVWQKVLWLVLDKPLRRKPRM